MKRQTKKGLPVVEAETNNDTAAQPVGEASAKQQAAKPTPVGECVLKGEDVKETKKVIEKIISFHSEVQTNTAAYNQAATNMVKAAIEAGKLLLAEKERRTNTFMLWVECYMPFSYETAGRYMRLAKSSHVTTLNEATSLRKAYQMCGIVKAKAKTGSDNGGSRSGGQGTGSSGSGNQEIKAYSLVKELMNVLPTYGPEVLKDLLPHLGETVIAWYTKQVQTTAIDLNHVKQDEQVPLAA